MKMNKITALLLSASMFFGFGSVFAETTPAPTDEIIVSEDTSEPTALPEETPDASAAPSLEAVSPSPAPTSSIAPIEPDFPINEDAFSYALGIDIRIEQKMVVTDSTAVFELYDTKGNLLGRDEGWIGGETESLYLHFDLPKYKLGTDFVLKLVDGLRYFKYYDDVILCGESTTLHTYLIDNGDGTYFQGNNFSINGCPLYEKGICVYYHGSMINFYPRARIVDGVAMASVVELGNAMKVRSKYYEEYNSVNSHIGPNEVLFNVGETYTTIFGNDTYISHAPVWVGDAVFVPIRDMCEAFGCSLEVLDFDDHLDIILSDATVVTEFLNQSPVNRNGIYSRTNYLVWVSKSEFTVRVYTGGQYNWELAYECPCAIGAWDSPTVEGQFEYQYRVSSWDYPQFYVSPVLVFYGGYALHSTLLSYGGGVYDNTVRAHISHGCVRLRPADINWIAARIPVGTRIYITG